MTLDPSNPADEYVCIFATGPRVREEAARLLEIGLVLQADLCERYPMVLNGGKARTGTNRTLAILIARRHDLPAVRAALREGTDGQGADGTRYIALPVLEAQGLE